MQDKPWHPLPPAPPSGNPLARPGSGGRLEKPPLAPAPSPQPPRRPPIKHLALAAILLTAPALAQPTLHIEADTATASIGDTITWTVRLSGITGVYSSDVWLGAYDLNLVASSQIAAASPFQTALSLLVEPTAGTPSGADLLGVSGGQSTLLDLASWMVGDVTVGTFTTMATHAGSLTYDIADGGMLVGTDHIRLRAFEGPIPYNDRPALLADTVTIIPAPATAALAAAGLVALRRRRAN